MASAARLLGSFLVIAVTLGLPSARSQDGNESDPAATNSAGPADPVVSGDALSAISGAPQDETTAVLADEPADESDLNAWDRLIYVPFRELKDVFNSQDASVVIPYREYLELLRHYLGERPPNGVSPDAVITAATYTAAVEEDVVRISASLNVRMLKQDGWATLPFSFGTAAVGSLQPDDGTAVLKGLGDGRYELLLQGGDDRTVTLELLAPVQTSPEARSFQINCPPTGISHLQVTVPQPDQSIQILPSQVILPPTEPAAEGTTVVRSSLGSTDSFEVRWNPRAGSKPVMDLLASVTNQTETRIESGLLQIRTQLTWEILRGELREVVVLAPKDSRIIDVVSAAGAIRSWQVDDSAPTHQQIRIELLNPATGRFQVELQTERNPQSDTFQLIGRDENNVLQGVHAEGVVREAGRIVVTTDPSLTAIVRNQSGLKQVDATVPQKGSSEPRLAWEFSGTTGQLVIQTRPVEPRLLVRHDAQIIFRDDELRLRSVLNYTVERAGVFQLVLTVPESLTIDNVAADGMSEFNVDKESGRLTLSLTQKRQGAIAVTIQAHQKFDPSAEDSELEIPTVIPEGAERETGTLTIYAPQFLDVLTVDERLVGLFPSREATAPALARLRLIGIWEFSSRPVAMVTRTSPRPAQVASTIATTARFEPDVVKLSNIVSFDIQNAGIDTLRISVPESVSDNVRFRTISPGHTIGQRNRAQQAVDGRVIWTLVLQDETTGTVQIGVDWEVPLNGDQAEDGVAADASVASADAAPAPTTFVVDPPRVLPPFEDDQSERRRVTLTQARGEIRLLRHESLSISAEGQGDTTEAVDVRELELMEQDGYLAFRYFAQPASAIVTIREHEIHEVVATVVSKAALEVVTEKQTLASWRCRFRVTSSERQRLRLDLPVGSELQAPLLNDQRTTIERATEVTAEDGWEAYYVNVSREQTSDTPFLLTIQYRCPIIESSRIPYEGRGGVQFFRLPSIGADDDSTVIQQTQLAVWAPRDVAFAGKPERWTQVGDSEFSVFRPLEAPTTAGGAKLTDRWIDQPSSGDFAVQGNLSVFRAVGKQTTLESTWWNRPFVVWIVSGTLVLLGLILRRTSWENRITLVLLAAFAVALWTLKDGYTALQFATAMGPGLAVVLMLWVVGLLLGWNHNNHNHHGNSSAAPQPGSPAKPVSAVAAAAPQSETSAPPAATDQTGEPPGSITPPADDSQQTDDATGGKQ